MSRESRVRSKKDLATNGTNEHERSHGIVQPSDS